MTASAASALAEDAKTIVHWATETEQLLQKAHESNDRKQVLRYFLTIKKHVFNVSKYAKDLEKAVNRQIVALTPDL